MGYQMDGGFGGNPYGSMGGGYSGYRPYGGFGGYGGMGGGSPYGGMSPYGAMRPSYGGMYGGSPFQQQSMPLMPQMQNPSAANPATPATPADPAAGTPATPATPAAPAEATPATPYWNRQGFQGSPYAQALRGIGQFFGLNPADENFQFQPQPASAPPPATGMVLGNYPGQAQMLNQARPQMEPAVPVQNPVSYQLPFGNPGATSTLQQQQAATQQAGMA